MTLFALIFSIGALYGLCVFACGWLVGMEYDGKSKGDLR